MARIPTALPPLDWIRVFEAAGRLGNFTAAAHEAGLTQAAVSQRIRNLEAHIGARLFDRQARGVSLTVEGEAWLPYVTNALLSLSQSTEDLFENPRTRVSLTASASLIELWIAPRLAGLKGFAQCQLSLHTMTVAPDYSRIDSHLEIRRGNGPWEGLRAAPLFGEVMTPMCAPSLRDRVDDWRELPRIAVSGPRPGWQNWVRESGDIARPEPALRFDSFVQALSAARQGAGVILGLTSLCGDALSDGSLVRLTDRELVSETGPWLVSDPGRMSRRQWAAFVEGFCQS